jgi:hypothetical protein
MLCVCVSRIPVGAMIGKLSDSEPISAWNALVVNGGFCFPGAS